jgi:hypothetical protein
MIAPGLAGAIGRLPVDSSDGRILSQCNGISVSNQAHREYVKWLCSTQGTDGRAQPIPPYRLTPAPCHIYLGDPPAFAPVRPDWREL